MMHKELANLLDGITSEQDRSAAAKRITDAILELETGPAVRDEEATLQDLKRAAVRVVALGQPSQTVIEMMEFAVGLHGVSRGRGNPGKPQKRRDAAMVDAFNYLANLGYGYERTSVRKLAKQVGVSRATILKWRKQDDYRELFESIASDDFYKDDDV